MYRMPTTYRDLYYAYHYSQVTNGIEVFDATTKANISKLQGIQNKSIKVLYKKEWSTPTKDLHKELKLLQVVDTYM